MRYLSDEEIIQRARAAVKIELEKKKILGIPAVVFDRKTQLIYYENQDGTRITAGQRLWKGQYSERIKEKT